MDHAMKMKRRVARRTWSARIRSSVATQAMSSPIPMIAPTSGGELLPNRTIKPINAEPAIKLVASLRIARASRSLVSSVTPMPPVYSFLRD